MILTRFLACAALALTLGSCGGDKSSTDISGKSVILPTIGSSGGALSNVQAKNLFGAKSFASSQSPAAYGSYAKGCIAGAQQLPETGPTWQAMRLSRNRNWAHPETVDMVKKLSAKAAPTVPMSTAAGPAPITRSSKPPPKTLALSVFLCFPVPRCRCAMTKKATAPICAKFVLGMATIIISMCALPAPKAREWQRNILNPPKAKPIDPNAPKPKPRRELLLADLPAQCKSVLEN